jgi:hypothetical protein
MQARAPQRLVGIDVPDPGHQGLVEQTALDARGARPDRADESVVVEVRVEWIPRDMSHSDGDAPTGIVVCEFVDVHASEHPLIDEVQFAVGALEFDANPEVFLIRGLRLREQQLSAHAEVHDQRSIIVEDHPEVLAPPAHRPHVTPRESMGKVGGTRGMAAYGSWLDHLDAGKAAIR